MVGGKKERSGGCFKLMERHCSRRDCQLNSHEYCYSNHKSGPATRPAAGRAPPPIGNWGGQTRLPSAQSEYRGEGAVSSHTRSGLSCSKADRRLSMIQTLGTSWSLVQEPAPLAGSTFTPWQANIRATLLFSTLGLSSHHVLLAARFQSFLTSVNGIPRPFITILWRKAITGSHCA